jgi:hypothetical protein
MSLISADRNNMATLLLTILCFGQVVFKGFTISNRYYYQEETSTMQSRPHPPNAKFNLQQPTGDERIVTFWHGFQLRGVQLLPNTW